MRKGNSPCICLWLRCVSVSVEATHLYLDDRHAATGPLSAMVETMAL
jgi:hypothetical protein